LREQLLLYRQRLLERFSAVKEELAQAVKRIDPEEWHEMGADGEIPHRILAYLRTVESQKTSVRLRRILDEEEPFLPLFGDKHWMEDHYDPDESPEDILAEYIALRSEESGWLQDLSAEEWNRSGRHPWWGKKSLQWCVEQSLHNTEGQLERLKAAGRK
jgi:hypothetical protein